MDKENMIELLEDFIDFLKDKELVDIKIDNQTYPVPMGYVKTCRQYLTYVVIYKE